MPNIFYSIYRIKFNSGIITFNIIEKVATITIWNESEIINYSKLRNKDRLIAKKLLKCNIIITSC